MYHIWRRGVYKILVGIRRRRIPIRRPRRRWEENNKMDLQEMEWGGIDWVDLAQKSDRWRDVVNAVMNFQVP